MNEPNHARRFGTIWLVATLIATPLAIALLGPILPPGNGSEQASGQVTDNTVLLAMATPVLLLVVIYLIYAVVNFRQPKGGVLEGPAVRGDARVQTTWIVVTSLLVLSLAVYGSFRVSADKGAAPAYRPQRPEAQSAGDRPAVGLHLPLPRIRRRRDHPPRPPREPDGRTS